MKSIFAAFLFFFAGLANAGDLGVNVYGLSYHPDRAWASESGMDNEVNPGIGLRWRDTSSANHEIFVDVGAYEDSGRNTAVLAGVGWMWKAWRGLRLGAAAAAMQSDTYYNGKPFIALLPVAGYDFGPVMLNAMYAPEVPGLNGLASFGFWATIWLPDF